MSFLPILALGGLLGFRHAFEPDHLAAVSTLASRPGASLWGAARLGLVWGLGHTATVGAICLLVVALGVRVPPALWPAAELVVAALLVLLGGAVLWRYARGRWHMHLHAHDKNDASPHLHLHSHAQDAGHAHHHATVDARRSLGFGIAHGLAGSGAIAVLLVAAAPSAGLRFAYFTAFGAGTVLGMLAVTVTIGGLVRLASERGSRWATLLHVGCALVSVGAGLVLAWRVMWE